MLQYCLYLFSSVAIRKSANGQSLLLRISNHVGVNTICEETGVTLYVEPDMVGAATQKMAGCVSAGSDLFAADQTLLLGVQKHHNRRDVSRGNP